MDAKRNCDRLEENWTCLNICRKITNELLETFNFTLTNTIYKQIKISIFTINSQKNEQNQTN